MVMALENVIGIVAASYDAEALEWIYTDKYDAQTNGFLFSGKADVLGYGFSDFNCHLYLMQMMAWYFMFIII